MLTGRIAAWAFAGIVCLGAATAEAQPGLLTGYGIASWNEEDGLPSSALWAVAQSADGDLWIGGDGGLVRFDGLRFTPWDAAHEHLLPTRSVRALVASTDGSVWAGYGDRGGVSRIARREQRHYGEADGLPAVAITMLFEDKGGGIWAGTLAGLFRLSDQRWLPVAAGLPPGAAVHSALIVHDRMLVGTANGIFSRTSEQELFQKIDEGLSRAIAVDAAGTIWVADPIVGVRRLGEHRALEGVALQARGTRLLVDRRGNLWVGNRGQGLWRLQFLHSQNVPHVERGTTLTGLSNDGIESLIEDAAGNIWLATSAGLNRLTPHKVTQVTDLGLVRGIEVSPDGDAWIGTVSTIVDIPAADIRQPRYRVSLSNATMLAMHADERGQLWVATTDALLRVDRRTKTTVTLERRERMTAIRAISSDRRGGVWLADGEQGLLRWNDGGMTRDYLPEELREAGVVAVRTDRMGRVWVPLADGRIVELDGTRPVRAHGDVNPRSSNQYRVLFEGNDGVMWLGGTETLGRIRDGRLEALGKNSGLPPGPIDAVIEDDQGAIWMAIFAVGIARVSRQDLDAAFDTPGHTLRVTMYDRSDGVAGTPQHYTVTSGARTADGRLWFVTGRGLTVIDPRTVRMQAQTVPSDVRLDAVHADGKPVGLSTVSTLPPRLARLELDYTVLNLTSPLKNRFRYRLEGFDQDWVDAGTRRQAVYTNLPPGDYQFRVITSEDGSWNKRGDVWAFSIAPAFYQTRWFLGACILALAGIVGGAWRFHLLEVRRRFDLVLNERARLSREIHDTLLQSMVGLSLQVDAIGGDLDAAPTMSKQRLVRLRKDLTAYIREARQSIRDLRSPMLEQFDLEMALRQAGEHMTSETGISFELTVIGKARRCLPAIEEQLLRIGQEAISNALRHASAKDIRVELTYEDATVAVRVVDNGSGFDLASVLNDRSGHLGVTSMKERAEANGGLFSVRSAIGKGTEVYAVIPAPQRSSA